jgi:hypothetical protein
MVGESVRHRVGVGCALGWCCRCSHMGRAARHAGSGSLQELKEPDESLPVEPLDQQPPAGGEG